MFLISNIVIQLSMQQNLISEFLSEGISSIWRFWIFQIMLDNAKKLTDYAKIMS